MLFNFLIRMAVGVSAERYLIKINEGNSNGVQRNEDKPE